MSKESGFVPLHDANTENIRFKLDLPAYLDKDSIRANTQRIQGIMSFGGISHLRVETYEANRVSSVPLIVGHDASGEAYAAKTGLSDKTQSHELNVASHVGNPKTNATVKIDFQKLASKIADETGLNKPSVWAREIDKEVLDTLRKGSRKSLLKDNPSHNKGRLLLFSGVMAVGFLLNPSDSLQEAIIRVAKNYMEDGFYYNAILRLGGWDDRFSTFMGPQVDRWAILQARTRIQHVVKGF